MRLIQRVAVAALAAGIAATTAVNGAEQPLPDEQAATVAASGAELSSPAMPSSPAEQAATAVLNQKIADDNAALDASEKAKQEAYARQVQQQQETYEQQVKQQQAQYEQQKADYARQLEEQKAAYQRQVDDQKAEHQRQLEQYEQQVSAASKPAAKSAR